MAYRRACVESKALAPTHALVKFIEEDTMSVVPLKRVYQGTGAKGTGAHCKVEWARGRLYPAVVVATGTKGEVEAKMPASPLDSYVDDKCTEEKNEVAEKCEEMDTEKSKEVDQGKSKESKKCKEKNSKQRDKHKNAEKCKEKPKEKTKKNKGKGTKEKPKKRKADQLTKNKSGKKRKETSAFEIKCLGSPVAPEKEKLAEIEKEKPAENEKENLAMEKSSEIELSDFESLFSSSESDIELCSTPEPKKVITLREVKSPPIHFHHIQDMETDIKEIKCAVLEIKELIMPMTQANFHRHPQSSYFQSQPQTTHFQPPFPPYQPPWMTEDYIPPLPPPILQLGDQEDTDPEFTTSFLASIRSDSCSRANFTAKLARAVFSEEERRSSNVKGVVGKRQLDPKRLIKVKESVFQIWPCETEETQSTAWNQCIKAIDEANRRLNRNK